MGGAVAYTALSVTPASMQLSLVRDMPQSVSVTVANPGGVATGPLSVSIPSHPYLHITLASPLCASLAGNTSFVITYIITCNNTTPLGTYSVDVLLSDEMHSLHATQTWRVQVLSSDVMSVRVVVEDEYTYFAADEPYVANAT